MNGIIQFAAFLYLASFTPHDVSEAHPCWYVPFIFLMLHNILLYGCTTFLSPFVS